MKHRELLQTLKKLPLTVKEHNFITHALNNARDDMECHRVSKKDMRARIKHLRDLAGKVPMAQTLLIAYAVELEAEL